MHLCEQTCTGQRQRMPFTMHGMDTVVWVAMETTLMQKCLFFLTLLNNNGRGSVWFLRPQAFFIIIFFYHKFLLWILFYCKRKNFYLFRPMFPLEIEIEIAHGGQL